MNSVFDHLFYAIYLCVLVWAGGWAWFCWNMNKEVRKRYRAICQREEGIWLDRDFQKRVGRILTWTHEHIEADAHQLYESSTDASGNWDCPEHRICYESSMQKLEALSELINVIANDQLGPSSDVDGQSQEDPNHG